MKRYAFLSLLLLLLGMLKAQETFQFRTDHPQGISVERSTADGIKLHYSIKELGFANIDNGEAKGQEIILKGPFSPNAEGRPNLPVINRYIAIPQGATVKLQVKENASTILTDIDLLPAAPLQTDYDKGLPQIHRNPDVYGKNAAFPTTNVVLSRQTQIRSLDVVLLSITPFRYNPVQRTLEVIYDIDIDVHFEGGNGQFGESRYLNPDWEHILRNLVLNGEMLSTTDYYNLIKSAQNRDEEGCEYLIIVPDDPTALAWADTLKAFRMKQGILTKIVRRSECGIGTAISIRNYLLNAYNTWAIPPAAVLLFSGYRNNQGIPPFYHNTVAAEYASVRYPTDYPYCDMNGDSLADMALSRVTATNAQEYRTFVEKTIQYETNPPTDNAYYDRPLISSGHEDNKWFMISSQSVNGFYRNKLGKNPINHYMMVDDGLEPDSSWSSGYNSAVLMNYFGPNGQNYIPHRLDELHDWLDTDDNAPLIAALNQGSFLTLYRDHSNYNAWWCPAFHNEDLGAINNEPPTFVLSISCSTSLFDGSDDCLIDAFCHKQQGGAVGGIGATSLTHSLFNDILAWGIIDCIWPDFLPDLGGETPPTFIRPSYILAEAKHYFGYHVFLPNWWPDREQSTMHLFCYTGETYLNLYTETPQPLQITHGLYQPTGNHEYMVTAEEGTLVCLSKDNQIIQVMQSNGQPCTFNLPDMATGEHFTLTATKQNRFRYEQEVYIIPSSGPYVAIEKEGVLIENEYNTLYNGEDAHFSLKLRNYGNSTASQVTMNLTCESPYISITQGNCQYQQLASNQAITLNNAFRFHIAENTPDGTSVPFCIHIDDGNGEKTYNFVQSIAAPELVVKSEITYENSDHQSILQIEREGITNIHLQIANEGHFDSQPFNLQLELLAPFITIDSASRMFNSLRKGSSYNASFRIHAQNSPVDEAWIRTLITLNDGSRQNVMDTLLPYGGFFETFLPASYNTHNWQLAGEAPWTLTNEEAYAGGYCAQSGHITHSQSTSLSITRSTPSTNISFFVKTLSEVNYDKLSFYVDNEEKGQWSGTTLWSKVHYPVSQGTHTFTWTYSKDHSVSQGQDRVWIDEFLIEPGSATIVSSGGTLITCESEGITIDCNYAYPYNNLEWTTAGDGHFDDPHTLHPMYMPGPQDVMNGGTTLTMNANGQVSTLELILTDEIIIGSTINGNSFIDPETTVFSHYSVESQSGIHYYWQLEPETAGFVFAHGAEADIVWNYNSDITQATLTVSSDAGCSQPLHKTIQIDILSAKEQSDMTFSLYPNPTDGKVNLVIGQDLQGQSVIEVYDVLGTQVTTKALQNPAKGQHIELNLQHLAPGMYIIKMTNSKGCWSQKVSVK